jgi:hypothetical protein
MKILKHPETKWSMKHCCTKCSAELEVETADVKVVHWPEDSRDPSYDSYTAECPLCQEKINIPEKSIPPFVRVKMQKQSSSQSTSADFYCK